MRYGVVVPLVLTALLVACATSPETPPSQVDRHSERAITALQKATDADSLAAAGLLSFSPGAPEESLDLFGRAVAAAPTRADILWLQAQNCHAVPVCDPEPMERRLRELDPSNGAGWLGVLARADSENDTEAKEAARRLKGTILDISRTLWSRNGTCPR